MSSSRPSYIADGLLQRRGLAAERIALPLITCALLTIVDLAIASPKPMIRLTKGDMLSKRRLAPRTPWPQINGIQWRRDLLEADQPTPDPRIVDRSTPRILPRQTPPPPKRKSSSSTKTPPRGLPQQRVLPILFPRRLPLHSGTNDNHTPKKDWSTDPCSSRGTAERCSRVSRWVPASHPGCRPGGRWVRGCSGECHSCVRPVATKNGHPLLIPTCRCCRASKTKLVKVKLDCGEGAARKRRVVAMATTALECACQPCGV